MRGTRYTEEQIVGILKEHEAGVGMEELCRRHGISQQTFYRWKTKYGGLEVGDAQKLRGPWRTRTGALKRLLAALPALVNRRVAQAGRHMTQPPSSGS